MASANFQAYDRTLRRMYMMNLMDTLASERNGGFRASLVVNAHTGLPADAQPRDCSYRRANMKFDAAAAA